MIADNDTRSFPQMLRHQLTIVSDVALRNPRTDLVNLLKSSKRKSSSDPRDKVYALLGLAPPWMVSSILPDYSKTCGQVYTENFVEYMKSTGDLDMLLYCDIDTKLEDAPTWVPNWCSWFEPLCRDVQLCTTHAGLSLLTKCQIS